MKHANCLCARANSLITSITEKNKAFICENMLTNLQIKGKASINISYFLYGFLSLSLFFFLKSLTLVIYKNVTVVLQYFEFLLEIKSIL